MATTHSFNIPIDSMLKSESIIKLLEHEFRDLRGIQIQRDFNTMGTKVIYDVVDRGTWEWNEEIIGWEEDSDVQIVTRT